LETRSAKLKPEAIAMSKILTSDLETGDAGKSQAAIEQIFVEIERDHEQMQRDQQEIDRLKARTRALLAQLEAA
jgi:hypothetical protein